MVSADKRHRGVVVGKLERALSLGEGRDVSRNDIMQTCKGYALVEVVCVLSGGLLLWYSHFIEQKACQRCFSKMRRYQAKKLKNLAIHVVLLRWMRQVGALMPTIGANTGFRFGSRAAA